MKNLKKLILSSLLTLLSFYSIASNVKAINTSLNSEYDLIYINITDYFIGKWKVQVNGTPNGDVVMNIVVIKVDGKYIGSVQTEGSGPEPVKADRVEVKENEFNIYWLAGGYNIYLHLEKVKDNIIEGTFMDMFDCKGERVIE